MGVNYIYWNRRRLLRWLEKELVRLGQQELERRLGVSTGWTRRWLCLPDVLTFADAEIIAIYRGWSVAQVLQWLDIATIDEILYLDSMWELDSSETIAPLPW